MKRDSTILSKRVNVIKCQACVRGFIMRKRFQALQKDFHKRNLVVEELISSERSYLKSLTTLIKVYMAPLKKPENSNLITKEAFKHLFSELEVIYSYNSVFLSNLEKRFQQWSVHQKIGDIILQITEFLKVYTQYTNNYNKAISTLEKCTENPDFLHFIQNASLLPECEGLNLTSFLIMPVQRIPRYIMLLTNLTDKTPKWHLDYENLNKALQKMISIANYLNEQKKTKENLSKMEWVHSNVAGVPESIQLLTPHRRYVREGQITRYINGSGSSEIFYVFLLNDILLWTKHRKNGYHCKYVDNLAYIQIRETADIDGKPALMLLTADKVIGLVFADRGEKLEWFSDLSFEIASVLSNVGESESEKHWTSTLKRQKTQLNLSASTDRIIAREIFKEKRKQQEEQRKTRFELENRLRFKWQLTEDTSELDKITNIESINTQVIPTQIYNSFSEVKVSLHNYNGKWNVPTVIFIGNQGSGKTLLINSLLIKNSVFSGTTKRPIIYNVVCNNSYSNKEPKIKIHRDEVTSLPEQIIDLDNIDVEIQKRNTLSSVPLSLQFECKDVLDMTIIDTPGLLLERDKTAKQVESTIYNLALNESTLIVSVEEAKSWEHFKINKIITHLDPKLSRTIFLFTKFNYMLQHFGTYNEIEKYFMSRPAPSQSFLLSLFSFKTGQKIKTSEEFETKLKQSYVRDKQLIMKLCPQTITPNFEYSIFNVKKHILNWVWKRYVPQIPGIIQYLVQEKEFLQNKLKSTEHSICKMSDINFLRIQARKFTSNLLITLTSLMYGNTQAHPLQNGQTVLEEIKLLKTNIYCWETEYTSNEELETMSKLKLYGGQQIQRLLQEFNFKINELTIKPLTIEELGIISGFNNPNELTEHNMLNYDSLKSIIMLRTEELMYPLLTPFFKRLKNMLYYAFELALNIHNSNERREEYKSNNQANIPFTHKFYPKITAYVKNYYKNMVKNEVETCRLKTLDIISTSLQLYRINNYINDDNDIVDVNKMMLGYFKDIKEYVSYNTLLYCYHSLAAEFPENIQETIVTEVNTMPADLMKALYQCDNIISQFTSQQHSIKREIDQIETQIASFSWRSEIDL